MTVPYASATSGTKARAEIVKMLQGFGCESIGFMDSFSDHSVLLAFTHRGRRADRHRTSARGSGAMNGALQSHHRPARRMERADDASTEGGMAQPVLSQTTTITGS
jgi:hypothetical protein